MQITNEQIVEMEDTIIETQRQVDAFTKRAITEGYEFKCKTSDCLGTLGVNISVLVIRLNKLLKQI